MGSYSSDSTKVRLLLCAYGFPHFQPIFKQFSFFLHSFFFLLLLCIETKTFIADLLSFEFRWGGRGAAGEGDVFVQNGQLIANFHPKLLKKTWKKKNCMIYMNKSFVGKGKKKKSWSNCNKIIQGRRTILAKRSDRQLASHWFSSKQKAISQYYLHPQKNRCVSQLKRQKVLQISQHYIQDAPVYTEFSILSEFLKNNNFKLLFEIFNTHEQSHFITMAYD